MSPSNVYVVIVLGGGAPGEHCAGALAARELRVAVVERELVARQARMPDALWATRLVPSVEMLGIRATRDSEQLSRVARGTS